MRGLKDRFIEDLLTGKLTWFLEELKKNEQIFLSIEKNFVNFYYKGNPILEVKAGGGYNFIIQEKYFNTPALKEEYAIFNRDKKAAGVYQRKFPILLEALDQAYDSLCQGQDAERQAVAQANPEILAMDYEITASCGGGTVGMIGVLQGKITVFGHNQGKNLAGLSADYQNAEKLWGNDSEKALLQQSVESILANRIALGLTDSAITLSQADDLQFVALLTDMDESVDLASSFQGNLPFSAYFLGDHEYKLDHSKAKTK